MPRAFQVSVRYGRPHYSNARVARSSLTQSWKELRPPPPYIRDYEVLYTDALQKLTVAASPLVDNWDPVGIGTNYQDLLSSHLSEICNNASLILRRMKSLCEEGWPKWFDKLNTDVLQRNRVNTDLNMRAMLRAADHRTALQISSIMTKGATLILECIVIDRISGMEELDLERASSAFLELAVDIENLLSDLLFEREDLLDFELLWGSTTSYTTTSEPLAV